MRVIFLRGNNVYYKFVIFNMKKIICLIFFVLNCFPVFAFALVNINTASSEELDTLPEIGPATATKIITYRTTTPFLVIEDIMKVSGIKEATFAKIKDLITVGDVSGGGTSGSTDDNDDTTSTSTATTTSNTTTTSYSSGGGGGGALSTHSDPESLTDYDPANPKIGAGRTRLAIVKTPVNFFASNDSRSDWNESSFIWTFGDGAVASGKKVSHAYEFSGNYNVVLNAKTNNNLSAVSRTTINVVEPELKISEVNPKLGFVEIENFGNSEKNINGWILKTASSTYIFPTDTIISKQSKIKFSTKNLGLVLAPVGDRVSLLSGDGTEFGRLAVAGNINNIKIKELKQKLNLLKQKLSEINNEEADGGVVAIAEPVILSEEKREKIVEQNLVSPKQTDATSTDIVINKPKGWLSNVVERIF